MAGKLDCFRTYILYTMPCFFSEKSEGAVLLLIPRSRPPAKNNVTNIRKCSDIGEQPVGFSPEVAVDLSKSVFLSLQFVSFFLTFEEDG